MISKLGVPHVVKTTETGTEPGRRRKLTKVMISKLGVPYVVKTPEIGTEPDVEIKPSL